VVRRRASCYVANRELDVVEIRNFTALVEILGRPVKGVRSGAASSRDQIHDAILERALVAVDVPGNDDEPDGARSGEALRYSASAISFGRGL
jgi:hypothetical protein